MLESTLIIKSARFWPQQHSIDLYYIYSYILRPESQLETKNSALAMMKLWWNDDETYDETYDVIPVKLFQNV